MYSPEMIEYLKEIKRYPDGFSFEASEKRADMDTLASAT